MGNYKVLVYVVQATYNIDLSWSIELYARGAHLNHLASPQGYYPSSSIIYMGKCHYRC